MINRYFGPLRIAFGGLLEVPCNVFYRYTEFRIMMLMATQALGFRFSRLCEELKACGKCAAK